MDFVREVSEISNMHAQNAIYVRRMNWREIDDASILRKIPNTRNSRNTANFRDNAPWVSRNFIGMHTQILNLTQNNKDM